MASEIEIINPEDIEIEGTGQFVIDLNPDEFKVLEEESNYSDNAIQDLFEDVNAEDVGSEFEDEEIQLNVIQARKSLFYLFNVQSSVIENELISFTNKVISNCKSYAKSIARLSDTFEGVCNPDMVRSIIYQYRFENQQTTQIVNMLKGIEIGKKISRFKVSSESVLKGIERDVEFAMYSLVNETIAQFKLTDLEEKLSSLDKIYYIIEEDFLEEPEQEDGLMVGNREREEVKRILANFLSWYTRFISSRDSRLTEVQIIPYKNINLYKRWCKLYGYPISIKYGYVAKEYLDRQLKKSSSESNIKTEFDKKKFDYIHAYTIFGKVPNITEVMTDNIGRGIEVLEYHRYIRELLPRKYGEEGLKFEILENFDVLDNGKILIYYNNRSYTLDGLFCKTRILSNSNISVLQKIRENMSLEDAVKSSSLTESDMRSGSRINNVYYSDNTWGTGVIWQDYFYCKEEQCLLGFSEYNLRILYEHCKQFVLEQSAMIDSEVGVVWAIPSALKMIDYVEQQQEYGLELNYDAKSSISVDWIDIEVAELSKSDVIMDNDVESMFNKLESYSQNYENTEEDNHKEYNKFLFWFMSSFYQKRLDTVDLTSICLCKFLSNDPLDVISELSNILEKFKYSIGQQRRLSRYLNFNESMQSLLGSGESIFSEECEEEFINSYTERISSLLLRLCSNMSKNFNSDEFSKALEQSWVVSDIFTQSYKDLILNRYKEVSELAAIQDESVMDEKASQLALSITREIYYEECCNTEKVCKLVSDLNIEIPMLSLKPNEGKRAYVSMSDDMLRNILIVLGRAKNGFNVENLKSVEDEEKYSLVLSSLKNYIDSDARSQADILWYTRYIIRLSGLITVVDSEAVIEMLNKNPLYPVCDSIEYSGDVDEYLKKMLKIESLYKTVCFNISRYQDFAIERGQAELLSMCNGNFELVFKDFVEEYELDVTQPKLFAKYVPSLNNKEKVKEEDLGVEKLCARLKGNRQLLDMLKYIEHAPEFKLSNYKLPHEGKFRLSLWQLIKCMDKEFRNEFSCNIVVGNNSEEDLEVTQLFRAYSRELEFYNQAELFTTIYSLPYELCYSPEDLLKKAKYGSSKRMNLLQSCEFIGEPEVKGEIEKLFYSKLKDRQIQVEFDKNRLLDNLIKLEITGLAEQDTIKELLY